MDHIIQQLNYCNCAICPTLIIQKNKTKLFCHTIKAKNIPSLYITMSMILPYTTTLKMQHLQESYCRVDNLLLHSKDFKMKSNNKGHGSR